MQNCVQNTGRHLKALRPFAVLAAMAALWLPVTPAQAQTVTSNDATTILIEPLTLAKLADMDFGEIFVTTGGTVVMTPGAVPTCTTTGGLVHSEECQPATFAGLGRTGQRVSVRRPNGRTITLTGPGADMLVTDLTIDGGVTLNPIQSNPVFERFRINTLDGSFIFWVGGTLNVNANQTPGLYTGTFDIRVDYQ